MGTRQQRTLARHPRPRLGRGRPQRGDDAPAGATAAEPSRRLDRRARRRALGRGPRHAAAPLAVTIGRRPGSRRGSWPAGAARLITLCRVYPAVAGRRPRRTPGTATAPMVHRVGCNRPYGPSVWLSPAWGGVSLRLVVRERPVLSDPTPGLRLERRARGGRGRRR